MWPGFAGAGPVTLVMLDRLPMPPKQFDHAPAHKVAVMDFTPRFLPLVCNSSVPTDRLMACYAAGKIYVRDDLTPKARAKVIRHEYGHVNGWHHR